MSITKLQITFTLILLILSLSAFFIWTIKITNPEVQKITINENINSILKDNKIYETEIKPLNSYSNFLKDVFVPILSFILLTLRISFIQEKKNKIESIEKMKIYAISHKIHELLIFSIRFFEKLWISWNNFYSSINDYEWSIKYIESLNKIKIENKNLKNELIYKELKNQDFFFDAWKIAKRNIKLDENNKSNIEEQKNSSETKFNNWFKNLNIFLNDYLEDILNNKWSNKLNNEIKFLVNKENKTDNFEYEDFIYNEMMDCLRTLSKQIYVKWWIKDNTMLNYISKIIEIIERIKWKIESKEKNHLLIENYNEFYLILFNINNIYKNHPEIIIKSYHDFESLLLKKL